MTVLATTLDPGQATLWWIALAVGAVVIGVVIVLFALLSRLLSDIRFGVSALDAMAERIETTSASSDLRATASVLRDIRDEIRVHDDLLSR